jgi:hypothetical protein
MTPEEAERERETLIVELDSGRPMTDEIRDRAAALTAHDWEHARTDASLYGRLGRELGTQYADMLAAAGITDAVPGSTVQDGSGVYVRSVSRGRVQIGDLDYRPLLAVASERAEDLEAKRRRPLEAKAIKKQANIRRAVELHRADHSPNRIAQMMTAERGIRTDPRTVRAWLAEAKSRTDRERSDSP